ncbi:hypothetical protein CEXT_364391 [Caerostris extrusa]|uniref:Uncharacterized protein n=1 Tax=Caerostris extrusa TaxID=172846 RepID=A0AAV4M9Y8_CAEEX|nr:hypothetical protein CEXT_364391 [Caerostris extrusa]
MSNLIRHTHAGLNHPLKTQQQQHLHERMSSTTTCFEGYKNLKVLGCEKLNNQNNKPESVFWPFITIQGRVGVVRGKDPFSQYAKPHPTRTGLNHPLKTQQRPHRHERMSSTTTCFEGCKNLKVLGDEKSNNQNNNPVSTFRPFITMRGKGGCDGEGVKRFPQVVLHLPLPLNFLNLTEFV